VPDTLGTGKTYEIYRCATCGKVHFIAQDIKAKGSRSPTPRPDR
jgi:hypothetical protein